VFVTQNKTKQDKTTIINIQQSIFNIQS